MRLVEQALAAEAPDFVLLQEASASLLYGDLTHRLVEGLRARGLPYELHYAPANGSLARGEAFEEGSAILSRWPIRDAAVHRLAENVRVEREYHGYRYAEYRIAVAATAEMAGGVTVEVISTHVTDVGSPTDGPSPRRLQVEDLIRFAADRFAARDVAILGGDFNAGPESEEVALVRRMGWLDVCAGDDPGPTNDPDDRDLESRHDTARHRIDHLFLGNRRGRLDIRSTRLFLAQPVEVEPGRHLWASDHNGLVTHFRLIGDRASSPD
jgi:endonuclease/exonuclease/phosphatase family metal-dependent hydrolase